MKIKSLFLSTALATTASLISPSLALAAAEDNSKEIDELWRQIDKLNQRLVTAEEWKKPNTLVHLAGFTGFNYENSTLNPTGTFQPLGFSPVFHYQYRDLVMLEAELDLTVTESGTTDVSMEYLTTDIFLNDNAVFVFGKFLSPLGNFRQNLHPSWINKAATAPTGFGHDQAAPNADTGVQVRGGFKLSGVNANYAVYIGNGVSLELNAAGDEIEKIESPGVGLDVDGTKNYGGRFGLYFPNNKLEMGVSLATGQTSEREISASGAISYANKRNWDMIGADLTYRLGGLDVRAEYVAQTIGALAASGTPDSLTVSAYYAQAAYRFDQSNLETLLRIGQYTNSAGTNDQTMLGVNYIFVSNLVAKLGYETNSINSNNRFLAQIAYGF